MSAGKIDALLALRGEGGLTVGRARIRLLEAIVEHGSITRAAKAVGISYKTAWDAVSAINNLMPTPAFVARAGGRAGGGAEITDEGRRLIATFHRLEERLARISALIAQEGLEGRDEALLWMLGARVSARNVFQARVERLARGVVDVEVCLSIAAGRRIVSVITNGAVSQLGLAPGVMALALVKAPFVRLAQTSEIDEGRANGFVGAILARRDGARASEVEIDIGEGKVLTAVAPREEADALGAVVGARIGARFDASHVILAVN